MAYVLGLTGNIASGKTTIGLMLLELGATVYCDADQVVHELYLPGQPLPARLAAEFGGRVLDAGGGVDRRVLGEIVFGDDAKLRQLEALVHPAVRAALMGWLRAVPSEGVGVLDAVKLVESGYAPLCHGVWVVTCPEGEQIHRMVTLRGMREADAQARLRAQPPIAPKLALASEVIENSGSLEHLRRQVAAGWERFSASLPRQ